MLAVPVGVKVGMQTSSKTSIISSQLMDEKLVCLMVMMSKLALLEIIVHFKNKIKTLGKI